MDDYSPSHARCLRLSRRRLCYLIGFLLVPVSLLETGCSSPGLAVSGSKGATIELVAMPGRKSLLGRGFFSRRESSPSRQAPVKTAPAIRPTTPESEERLLAVARLFMAQGRTQEAMRIYQQLGKKPEEGTVVETSQPSHPEPQQLPSPEKPLSKNSTPAKPATASTAATSSELQPTSEPQKVKVVESSLTNQAANGGDDKSAATAEAAHTKTLANEVVPQKHPKLVSSGSVVTVSSAPPLELPNVATGISRVPPIADTPGWQDSGSSALPFGLDYVTATGISGLPQPWSDPSEEHTKVTSQSSYESSSTGSRFQLPTHSNGEEWNAALHVVPGKFVEPSIRPGRPGSSRNSQAEPEQFAAPQSITRANDSAGRSLEETEEPLGDVDDVAEESTATESEPSLLIIPNGVGAAAKLARARKTNRRASVPSGKQPSQSELEPADLLLSEKFRNMHSPKVLEAAKLLTDSDPKQRAEAARRLGQSEAEARTILPLLRDRLSKEKEKLVKVRLAEAIVKIAPDDEDAVEKLTQMLRDPLDWKTRQTAAAGLAAAAAGDHSDAVMKLVEALNDSHPRVRAMVALTLGAFGPKAKEALPRLQFAATTDIPRVQEAAEAAIACIHSEHVDGNALHATSSGKLTESQEPGLLPTGVESGEDQSDSLSWLNEVESKIEDGSNEDDGDPFHGTLLDFDATPVNISP